MLLRLRRDNGLLHATQKLLRLGQGQTKIRDLTKVSELLEFQHVDTPSRSISSHLHQANNPPHPRSPIGNGQPVISFASSSPTFWTLPPWVHSLLDSNGL